MCGSFWVSVQFNGLENISKISRDMSWLDEFSVKLRLFKMFTLTQSIKISPTAWTIPSGLIFFLIRSALHKRISS
jgi:hypothetical protein